MPWLVKRRGSKSHVSLCLSCEYFTEFTIQLLSDCCAFYKRSRLSHCMRLVYKCVCLLIMCAPICLLHDDPSLLYYQSHQVTDLMCQEIACTMNVVIIISKICVVTSCDLVLCRQQAGSCVRGKSVQIRKIGEIHQRRREVSGKQVQGVQEVNTRNHS